MKKLFSMILALCLLMAAVPALAEDFGGLWHLTLEDVDLGWMQFDEDGTATAYIVGSGDLSGSWSSTAETVTATLDGQTVVFSWDGTMLFSRDLMIPVVREQGRVSADIASAYFNDQEFEVPEGMTREEVTAICDAFKTEFARLSAEQAAAAQQGAADAGYTVDILSENFYVMESYSGYRAIWLAQVMNLNPVPVAIRGGTMTVLDAEGNQVGKADYLYDHGSDYLEPGETVFLSMKADIPENVEVTYTRELEVSDRTYRKDITLTVSDSDFSFGEGEYSRSYMWTTVTNNTENPASVNVSFALKDAEGTVWWLDEDSLYRCALCPGSSIIMNESIDDGFIKLMQEKGVQITAIETYSWAEIED